MRVLRVLIGMALVMTSTAFASRVSLPERLAIGASPIKHIVILFQENHSFDNALGVFCIRAARCDGVDMGALPDGSVIPLSRSPDVVPDVMHDGAVQRIAIDGERMDGFGLIPGCQEASEPPYACYSQYAPRQIPNLTALASRFAVSDRTFELNAVPSFGAHLELTTTTLDGFTGNHPKPSRYTTERGLGWGCDSFRDAAWIDPRTGHVSRVPSCIPDATGFGAYRHSPVRWVPTIMDRLEAAGRTWKIFATTPDSGSGHLAYGWAICPMFAECIYSDQAKNVVPQTQFVTDAVAGTLPSFSILLPNGPVGRTSQHNGDSMAVGDNWIGQAVQAVEDGPEWLSTALFITYDDCGCFYDHVPPPPGLGIRVPMVIVSPYARPRYTDSQPASFASMLAFTEHTFRLDPLTTVDASAYGYAQSFDYSQPPLDPISMVHTPVPTSELRWIRNHAGVDTT